MTGWINELGVTIVESPGVQPDCALLVSPPSDPREKFDPAKHAVLITGIGASEEKP